MEKTKGMTTCKVCGRDFPLLIEEHYVSKEAGRIGFAALAVGPAPILWDSFDCPHCGCQNRMQQRERLSDILGQDLPLDVEEDEDDEESECSYGCCNTNPHPAREEQ